MRADYRPGQTLRLCLANVPPLELAVADLLPPAGAPPS